MMFLWIEEEATYSKLLSIFNSLFQFIYMNISVAQLFLYILFKFLYGIIVLVI